MVAEFEIILEAVRTARREYIGARADLEVITAELLKVVKVLDGITRYRFGMNPEMMAEWQAVKQVPAARALSLRGSLATPGSLRGSEATEAAPLIEARHRAVSPRQREGRESRLSSSFQGP